MDPTKAVQVTWDKILREANQARILKGPTWVTNLVKADLTSHHRGLILTVQLVPAETWNKMCQTVKIMNQTLMKTSPQIKVVLVQTELQTTTYHQTTLLPEGVCDCTINYF